MSDQGLTGIFSGFRKPGGDDRGCFVRKQSWHVCTKFATKRVMPGHKYELDAARVAGWAGRVCPVSDFEAETRCVWYPDAVPEVHEAVDDGAFGFLTA